MISAMIVMLISRRFAIFPIAWRRNVSLEANKYGRLEAGLCGAPGAVVRRAQQFSMCSIINCGVCTPLYSLIDNR